jgi:hypothetical protein
MEARKEKSEMSKKRGLSILAVLTAALIISGCGSTNRLLTPLPLTPSSVPTTVVPPTSTTAAPGPTPIASGEGLAENEVRISSYPPSAEVYLVPATVDIYDLELEDIMQTDNLLGTAPLTYELSPGTYYVVTVFTPDLFAAARYDLPTLSDPTFDYAFPFDGNLSQSMSFIGGEEIERISKIYRLIKGARNSEALISIALPLPENQRGQQKPVLYPTLATVEALPVSYTFDDAVVRRAIEDNLSEHNLTTTVGPSMVDEMVEVLLRVGKVKLDTSDVDLIIDMHGTDTSSFSISVYE